MLLLLPEMGMHRLLLDEDEVQLAVAGGDGVLNGLRRRARRPRLTARTRTRLNLVCPEKVWRCRVRVGRS